MICTTCLYENSEEGKFCSQCGAPLVPAHTDSADEAPVKEENPATEQVAFGDALPDSEEPDNSAESQISLELQDDAPVPEPEPGHDVSEAAEVSGEEDNSSNEDAGAGFEADEQDEEAADALQGDLPEESPGETVSEGISLENDQVQTEHDYSSDYTQSYRSAAMETPSLEDAYASLQNIPEIGTAKYPPISPALDATAVMPPISKNPVRYSVGDREREDAKRRRNASRGAMAFAALLAVIAILGVVYFLSTSPARGTEVPDVVGMSADSARSELVAAGFQVDVESQLTEDNFGMVLSCDPSGGEKRRAGSTVTITVSASRTIPDVVGMDSESAQNKLKEEGAENIKVVEKASNQPEGTVVDVEPKAGSNFNPGDEITLSVAKVATVPDVVGMQEEEAKAAIDEAGYVPEVKWTDSDYDAGTVVSTNPDAGSNANLDSTVTIYVASPGPRDMYHLFDFFDAESSANSEYLKWKGFTVAGSYTYDADGTTYASQIWQQPDGSSISFTPAPYTVDMGLSTEDYMSEGFGYQGIRLYIPNNSSLSLGTNVSIDAVHAYMDACGFDNLKDSCTQEDVESEDGKSGKELGLSNFICAQGETNGRIWTILVTDNGTYLGCGPQECYKDMDPICDATAINEMFAS